MELNIFYNTANNEVSKIIKNIHIKKGVYIMDIKTFAAIFGLIVSILFAGGAELADNCRQLRENILRLHILAESDEEADQQLKLAVRDALLEHSEELFGSCDNLEEMIAAAEENKDEICRIAEETLRKRNCYSNVTVEIEKIGFDDRVYGGLTVPGGEYTAVRVNIGSGNGKNWWCVMFPPLCIPCFTGGATEEEILEEYENIISKEQAQMLYSPAEYQVRFYFAELLEQLADYLNSDK